MINVETDLGVIKLSRSIIVKSITDVVDSFDGNVILSNSRGKKTKFAYKIGPMEEADNIKIELGEDGLSIRIYVILRFGTSISRTTRQLIDGIREDIYQQTAIKTKDITVIITGMLSKHFAPRHIEVTG